MKKIRVILIILFFLTAAVFVGGRLYVMLRVDRTPPVIRFDSDTLLASVKVDEQELLQGVTALDDVSGNLTDEVVVNGISKLVSADTAVVTYLVFDQANNMGVGTRYIRYTDYRCPTFTLTEPLIYGVSESIPLIDRLKATDVVDGDISRSIRVTSLDVLSYTPGTYDVAVQVTNSLGDTARVTLPLTLRAADETGAEVRLNQYLVYLKTGDRFDPMSYLDGVYLADEALGTSGVSVSGAVDTGVPGSYRVCYSYASDSGLKGITWLAVIVE